MLDLRQTTQYANFMENIGFICERINGVNYFIKKIPIIGSFIKIQRPEKIEPETIKKLIQKYRAFQVLIEPKYKHQEFKIKTIGFNPSKTPFLPSKTIHINLEKSERRLLSEMHPKTRYNIRLAKKKGLKIKFSDEIEIFANFWQECARNQRRLFLSQKKEIIALHKAFKENSHIVLCYKPDISSTFKTQNSKIISAILMLNTKYISYYMYASSSLEGKKLFAPTLNVWASIKLAKRLKCKIFDFEGIYDERFPLKSWLGFTRFKKSFGGEEIEYPEPHTKNFLPI